MNKHGIRALAVSLVIFSACATSGGKNGTQPSGRTNTKGRTTSVPSLTGPSAASSEGAAVREIQTLYSKGAYEAALSKIREFEQRFPKSNQIGYVDNLHGLIFLAEKNPSEAISYFQKSIKHPGLGKNFTDYIIYNLATAQIEAGQTEEALKSLDGVHPENLDQDTRMKLYHLRSQIHLKRESYLDAARDAMSSSRFVPDAQIAHLRTTRDAPLTALTERALSKIDNTLALEQLYRDSETAPLADLILLELVRKEMAVSNFEKASQYQGILAAKFPDSPSSALAAELIGAAQSTAPADPQAIGVLLPLKGKFAKWGARSLQGIELALRMFNSGDSDSKLTLIVEDSGEEPERAIAALNRLVLHHHVIAVIGPLLSKGIEQINQRAQELRVPLISLARYTATSADHVVQGGLTMKIQAEEVAKYALERLNLRRFAILAPRDKIGEEAARSFWDAVEANGGEIVGFESYSPGETDFRQPVDKLSGLYYTEARQRELDALAKEREVNRIRKRTRKTEQYFALKPIVNYDAVFIPDEPRISGQILPTFAYRDVDHVRFLGTSAWNSADFISRAQHSAENAIFVDAFFPEAENPAIRTFIENYRSTFGQDPTAMEALSYDAAKILEYAVSRGATNRAELLANLKAVNRQTGVTGRISYKDGQLTRNLQILTIQNGRIREVTVPR